MSEFKLTTPVVFIIFNRPDLTQKVFSEIAKAEPTKLLVIGDGARIEKVGEKNIVESTREIIQQVDWDCEVITNYSNINLGCKKRISSGLDWVFEQVEDAIILEDDCIPEPTFFRFCQEMLTYYRYDKRISMISGSNFSSAYTLTDHSYHFSKYSMIWGWASWRDRWTESYDVKLLEWPRIRDEKRLADMLGNKREVRYWRKIFERVYCGEIDSWAYQWFFANWLEQRISIVPSVNLISNIGYGENATHTTSTESHLSNLERKKVSFPVIHPVQIVKNIKADQLVDELYFRGTLSKRIRQKMHAILNKLLYR